MSDIIETIKQGAEQVLSGLDQKGQLKSAFDGIRSQWNEMERRRKVNSLDSEVKTLQREMKQLTEALGLQTLSLYDTGKIDHPELSRLCERIDELRSEIEQKRAEIATLKALPAQTQAIGKCSQCQSDVPPDSEFCPKCGARFQAQTPESPAVAATKPRTAAPAATVVPAATRVRLRCPKCKTILSPEAGFCPTCGVKIKRPQAAPAGKHFCSSCGAQTNPNARFCPICGQTLNPR